MATCVLLAIIVMPSIAIVGARPTAGINQSDGHIDHVHCSTNSPNCIVYVNQTVTFICKCFKPLCLTTWELNSVIIGNSNGANFTLNVTQDLSGIMVCFNNSQGDNTYKWIYKWIVTVLKPTRPEYADNISKPDNWEIKATVGVTVLGCMICILCTIVNVYLTNPENFSK